MSRMQSSGYRTGLRLAYLAIPSSWETLVTVHPVSDRETPMQTLARFREHTGIVFQLRPFEKVLAVRLDDDAASVLVDTYKIQQMARGWRLLKHGKRLTAYTRTPEGVFKYVGQMDTWDEDFEPIEVAEIGSHRSVKETIERLHREREAFRVGTRKRPQDSWARELDGYGPEGVTGWRND